MVKELRRMRGERAPADFVPRVMRAVGIADEFARLESPLGPVYVAWNRRGIAAVIRAGKDAEFVQRFRARFERTPLEAASVPSNLRRALASGKGADVRRLTFDLRTCSEFESAVLRKALEIPRGQVRPYGWIAREIGRPRATRAVGSALRKNPVPLLVPCHRVVRSDGMLGQYALGAPQKVRLLASEGLDPVALEREARAGTRYVGTPTTRIFCLPTCADVRRIKPAFAQRFSSERAARAAGYRPCRHCRPAALVALAPPGCAQ